MGMACSDSEAEVDKGLKAATKDKDHPSYKHSLTVPDTALWEAARDEEVGIIWDRNTVELCEALPGALIMNPLWVQVAKRNQEGMITRRRARLVVQGNQQRPGIDFSELFAHVVRSDTLHTLFATATLEDWDIHGMDVASAFLNRTVEEELYMRQIPGYEDGTNRVLHIKGSLYGLRQAPQIWEKMFFNKVSGIGFSCFPSDSSVYIR
jgi:hypothetical protein